MNNKCLMPNMNESTENNTMNNMTANLSNDNIMINKNNCGCGYNR